MENKESNISSHYLDIFGMIWVTTLVVAMLASAKTFALGPFIFSVSVIAYPITYIFADIFTEVYGYARTRRIIWAGMLCVFVASLMTSSYALVPPDASYTNDSSYRSIFLGSPALAIAVILAFWAGELTNSYVLARMKLFSRGRMMSVRFILSTFAGQVMDNTLFYIVANILGGEYEVSTLPLIIASSVGFCTLWEILALPLTTRVVRSLKKAENMDVYDWHTNFNPFSFKSSAE